MKLVSKGWFVKKYKISYSPEHPLMNAQKKKACVLMLGEYDKRSEKDEVNCLHEVFKRKKKISIQ